MIVYSHVLPESAILNQIEMLYVGSFPPVERRAFANVKVLLEKDNVPFHIIAATEGDELVGFLSYWDFGTFRYIEHFAVDVKKRGNGIGMAAWTGISNWQRGMLSFSFSQIFRALG